MPSPSATPVAYDFRRPNKFTREHVRALQIAHETFARQFTTVLSTTLRTVSQVQARGIGQLT
ncbi:MAG: flagellar motor switch protein FliM, partial [Actinomycetota bacterium]|nr:flagellar motor switch protein FliM [Actinomycetota bacterium]